MPRIWSVRESLLRQNVDVVLLFRPPSHLLSLPFFLLSSLLSFLPNFPSSERLHTPQATSPQGYVWLAEHLKLSDFFLQSLTPTLSRKSWRGEARFPPPPGAPGRSSVVAHTPAPPLPSCVAPPNCFIALVPQISHLYESNRATCPAALGEDSAGEVA